MNDELMRRLTKHLWMRVGKLNNPWLTAVTSNLEGYREKWERWNRQHIELMRAMFDVVFGRVAPTDALLRSALDMLEGQSE